MKPEGSLLCSQEPANGPYPDPDEPIPSRYVSLNSILILFSNLFLHRPSCLFHSGFPTKILCAYLTSPTRATCRAHGILLDLIILTL
jgi:hypothetical protein